MSSLSSRLATSARDRSDLAARIRGYFFSDTPRTVQTILGLIWLLDGALQFQTFMYGKGFIQMLMGMAPDQPIWLRSSLTWTAHAAQHDLTLFNTLFALIQVGIGLGLLYRGSVKYALAVSFAWALFVWWFGEAFGMLFMNMANALTGAPGAAILYALVGALVWPNDRPGGLIGPSLARVLWANLWILMGVLWLLAVNSSANATYSLIKAAPAGSAWLASLQNGFMDVSRGHGLTIAVVLAGLSFAIGLAVCFNWQPRAFLWIAIVLNVVYWFVGQGLGGILTGTGTDPDAAPLFVLLAVVLYSLAPQRRVIRSPI